MNELLALHHLSSEEVLQILLSTKHRVVFISLIQTLKQSEIEQHRLLPEFQNKIVSLQSNYLINSDEKQVSPWEGLEYLIERGMLIPQMFVELLSRGWNTVLEPVRYMYVGLQQGWYTVRDIKPRLERFLQRSNLDDLRKIILLPIHEGGLEMKIVLAIVKKYSQQEDTVMVQSILDACPALLEG